MTPRPLARLGPAGLCAMLLALLLAGCTARAVEPTPEFAIPIPPDDEPHPIAFEFLPKTKLGYVDWVAALQQGVITPYGSITEGEVEMIPIDFDVVFPVKGDIPDVVYPHLPHTQWLDCRNCHPAIFKMKAGSNPVTMQKIVEGEYCGRCHGKVAFPLYDCARCHSKPKK
jgi:c(7)-type cytochrome triheme protein